MNVTFVLPDGMCLSGVVAWSIELCRRLARLNQPVTLVRHPDFGPRLDVPIPPEVHIVSCCENPTHPNGLYVTESDVADYLADYRRALPSTIIPNWSPGAYATCALISKDEPEALRVIGFAHADEDYYYELLYYYEPLIHLFVAVSDEIAATLKQGIPHRERDIVVCPYAVNVHPSLDRHYSPPTEPIQLMYAGRVVEQQKRVSDLIHLAKALEREGVNFHLRIVGDGPDKENLRDQIQALDESTRQRVTLVGSLPIDQMPKAWKSADVCILVSEYEGTSVSMLEAMANGCIPVVTRVSGTAAVIEPEVNGFLAPAGDIAEMAQLIKALDRDRQQLAELGAQAHATIVERFSYEEYVQWLLKVVDEIWQQEPRPWPTERPILPRQLLVESATDRSSIAKSLILEEPKNMSRIYAAPAHMWLSERVMLYSLIYGLKPRYCLEIGSDLGGSATIICAAMDDRGYGKLVCVDPDPHIAAETWQQISHRSILLQGYSPQILPEAAKAAGGKFEFVFIDANHSYEGVLRDIEGTLPILADEAYLLFHDYHYVGVREAIEEALHRYPHQLIDCGLVSVDQTILEEYGKQVAYAGLRLLRFQRLDHTGEKQPTWKIIKAIGFKIAAKPGLRWLYRFRGLGEKLLGG